MKMKKEKDNKKKSPPPQASAMGDSQPPQPSASSSSPDAPGFLQPSVSVKNRFTNPWDTWEVRGFTHVAQWQLMGKNLNGVPGKETLDQTLPVVKPDFAQLENPPADKVQAMWIGHATVLAQLEGLTVLTDPVFTDRCSPMSFAGPKRIRPTPFPVEQLPKVDVVMISHNHYDHLSLTDVQKIGNGPLWCVPLGLKKWMNDSGITNVVELDWWQEHQLILDQKTYTITSVPCQHWSKRGIADDNLSLWCGWSVASPNLKFYFAGDTGYCPVFKQIGAKCGPFDLAAIPIGAYEPRWFMRPQHINPEEAVLVHMDIRAKKSLGVHWGTFMLTDEHYLDPPKKLKESMQAHQLPEEDFFVKKHGEIFTV